MNRDRATQPDMPPDWADLHWHRAPGRARFYTRAKAERACRWLNSNVHEADRWMFRVGGRDVGEGRWWLERRWVGDSWGVV